MKKIIYITYGILVVTLYSNCVYSNELLKSLDDFGSVVFVNVLYRHGNRTPEEPYPTDPYRNVSLWPVGWGQLTNEGKLTHYNLGKWIRERYLPLIRSGKYSSDLIYVQSTDYDRTLTSAMSNLAGMFPPTATEKWSNLKWQPIPVHTIPLRLDKVLAMDYPCKKYEVEMIKVSNSPEVRKINIDFSEMYKYLTEHTGQPVNDVKHLEFVFSTLGIEHDNYLTLPNWTKAVFPDKMYPAAAFSFALPTLTPKLKRLKGGPLLKEMVGHMKEKQSGKLTPNRNFWVYSAHDTTVANFLNTIGVFQTHVPPFAALVLVELRKNANDQYFVSVLYKNTSSDPNVMVIPGCTAACPLDQFEKLLQDVIPEDWESECHSHQLFDLTSDQPYNSLAIFAMVTSTLLVFLLLASTSLYWHKQKPVHLYRKLKMENL